MSDRGSTANDTQEAASALPVDSGGIIHETRDTWKARPRFAARDLAILGRVPLWFAIAWIVPQARWPLVARPLASDNPSLVSRIGDSDLGQLLGPAAIAAKLEANRIEHSFQYFRDYRPGGWRIPNAVEGLEHLAEAQASGRGVVLWMAHFVFHGLAAKKLLSEAGFQVHHVSRPEHGFSKTAFGIRVLNPLRVRVEDRYLASRILIRETARSAIGERIRKLLRDGQMVSITAGAWEGRRIAHVPFLGGHYPLATGAPALAHAEGARLIPVFCWRGDAPDGRLTLRVDPPIDMPANADRRQAIDHALREFVERHDSVVRAAPTEWRGWNYLDSQRSR